MDQERLRELLRKVGSGEASVEQALAELKTLPFEDLGFAKLDHHRSVRKGFPEVIFGQGKTPEQVAKLAEAVLRRSDQLLITRVEVAAYDAVKVVVPDAVFEPTARTVVVDRRKKVTKKPGVAVVCAGTADLPVALEACVTAEAMGSEVRQLFDVGVAGLHRLLANMETLQSAKVLVVVAGMDGVLPSVVGGLVEAPVIAVPTSVGYGSSFEGLAALLTMMNSCAPGVGVVNIDNGFGGGYLAATINKSVK
ncbi:MAG: nickel pincer cofactor biosynthesis protein LarB [Chloroflexi bacterium]|nr:nickel pincer cofactor biosynthesis protein LarB [Chloroflexota bacterium]